jgi:hypothetical protein
MSEIIVYAIGVVLGYAGAWSIHRLIRGAIELRRQRKIEKAR